jgi:RNA-directed DNA polymerase
MPRSVSRENMLTAYHAVKRNVGAAGIDEMSMAALSDWVRKHWEQTKASLLEGRYEPQPVKRVDICFGPPHGPHPLLRYGQPVGWLSRSAPSLEAAFRTPGIPTVCGRLIQQAIRQVLSPRWEREFSPHSYGFRPRRSTHDAVKAARAYVAQGHRWGVDMDLERLAATAASRMRSLTA